MFYNVVLFQTQHQEYPSLTTSMIKFSPKRSDNGHKITCRAENPDMVGSAREDSVTLAIMCT